MDNPRITFTVNQTAFYTYTAFRTGRIPSIDEIYHNVLSFATHFNCTVESDTLEEFRKAKHIVCSCEEEDFLIIRLTCPEAVGIIL